MQSGQPAGPNQEQNKPAGSENLSVNNPDPERQLRNDDYKREGVHLGGSSSNAQESGSTPAQKGGGGSGYDPNEEQRQVNREQEEMHREREQQPLQPERIQTPKPQTDPGRENPGQNPGQPGTAPETDSPEPVNG